MIRRNWKAEIVRTRLLKPDHYILLSSLLWKSFILTLFCRAPLTCQTMPISSHFAFQPKFPCSPIWAVELNRWANCEITGMLHKTTHGLFFFLFLSWSKKSCKLFSDWKYQLQVLTEAESLKRFGFQRNKNTHVNFMCWRYSYLNERMRAKFCLLLEEKINSCNFELVVFGVFLHTEQMKKNPHTSI